MGPFIQDVINPGRQGGLPKDDFSDKAYLVKVMTMGEGVKNFQKNGDVVYEWPLCTMNIQSH